MAEKQRPDPKETERVGIRRGVQNIHHARQESQEERGALRAIKEQENTLRNQDSHCGDKQLTGKPGK